MIPLQDLNHWNNRRQAMRRSNSIGGITKRSRLHTSAPQHNLKPYRDTRLSRETSTRHRSANTTRLAETAQLQRQICVNDLRPGMKVARTDSCDDSDASSVLKRRLTTHSNRFAPLAAMSYDSARKLTSSQHVSDNIFNEILNCSDRKTHSMEIAAGKDKLATADIRLEQSKLLHALPGIQSYTETRSEKCFQENTPPTSAEALEMNHKYLMQNVKVARLELDNLPQCSDVKTKHTQINLPLFDQHRERSASMSNCINEGHTILHSSTPKSVRDNFDNEDDKAAEETASKDNEVRDEDSDKYTGKHSIHTPVFQEELGIDRFQQTRDRFGEENSDTEEIRTKSSVEDEALHNVTSLRRKDTLVLSEDQEHDDDYENLFKCLKNLLCQKLPDDDISNESEEEDPDGDMEDGILSNNSASFKNLLRNPTRLLCAICRSHLEVAYFRHLDPDFQQDDLAVFHGGYGNMGDEELYCPRCCCSRNIYHPR